MPENPASPSGRRSTGRAVLKWGGIVAGLLILIVGVLMVPAVQTALARRVLASSPGTVIDFERLQVGWNSVVVQNLRLTRPELVVEAPLIEADVSLFGLMRGNLTVGKLQSHGWTVAVDLPRQIAMDTPPAAPQVAPITARAGWSWLAQLAPSASEPNTDWESWLDLPMTLQLDGIDLQGIATWTATSEMPGGRADLTVSGGGIGGRDPGTVQIDIVAQPDDRSVGVDELTVSSRLGVGLADGRRITIINLNSRLQTRLPESGQVVTLGVETHLVLGDPRRELELALNDGQAEIGRLTLSSLAGTTDLSGAWSLAISDRNIRPFLMGYPLPAVSVTGGGNLNGNLSTQEVSWDGAFDFTAGGLDAVRTELAAVGDLSGRVTLESRYSASGLRITALAVDVNGAAPVGAFRLLQGVEFDQTSGELRVETPTEDVFSLGLTGLPASWMQPWLEPWVLDSHPISGRWVGAAVEGGVIVRSAEPMHLSSVSVSRAGESFISGLDIAVGASVAVAGEAWQVEVSSLEVTDGQQPMLAGSLRAGRELDPAGTIKVEGALTGDLTTLLRQEKLGALTAVQSGNFSMEFTVGLTEKLSLAWTASAPNLALRDGTRIPAIVLEGRVDVLADGVIEAHVPVQLEQAGRHSEVTVNLQGQPRESGWLVAGSVSGPRAYLSDFQVLALMLPTDVETAATPGLPPAPVPNPGLATDAVRVPVWAGWEGTLQAAIGEVVLPNGMSFTDLRTTIILSPEAVDVDSFSLGLGDAGHVATQGRLEFNPARAEAYALSGRIEGSDVDVGSMLRLLKPGEPPVVEGRFALQANATGQATDLLALADNLAFDARLDSTDGVLRALNVKITEYVRTGQAVAALTGLVALASGNERLARNAGRVEAAGAVASQLSEIAFDQLNLEFARPRGGDYQLRNLSLISPTMRLVGSGAVDRSAGTPFWSSPLQVSLSLSAREGMANNLRTLNLLRNEPDALGYAPMTEPLDLRGTLSEISSASVQNLLGRAITALRGN